MFFINQIMFIYSQFKYKKSRKIKCCSVCLLDISVVHLAASEFEGVSESLTKLNFHVLCFHILKANCQWFTNAELKGVHI